MKLTSMTIGNFKAIQQSGSLEFGQVNLLVGPNNAGKSSILQAIHLIQESSNSFSRYIRLGEQRATVDLRFEEADHYDSASGVAKVQIAIERNGESTTLTGEILVPGRGRRAFKQLPASEPGHFVVPLLSKRKVVNYAEDVRASNALSVRSDFTHLSAKLSRLANPDYPGGEAYRAASRAILGFVVTAVLSPNGQKPGVFIGPDDTILVEEMGEGVPSVVGMLMELVAARNKIFLIEEPENDLHPRALKKLLDLMLESSTRNQMVVSTHSHIVVKHLGTAPSLEIFYVDGVPESSPPRAQIRKVGTDSISRTDILVDLGYEMRDFDMWDGWIFLEESSAERIIKDYMIPWFAPRLAQRVRTIAAGGISKVSPTFDDFHRLFVFAHLQPMYRERAWVAVDGDAPGLGVIAGLRAQFSDWDPEHFVTFSKEDFERYYPPVFLGKVEEVLATPDRQLRRLKKRALLEDVRSWIAADDVQAQAAFRESAGEVIDFLRSIEAAIFGDA